jgi:gamma-glutamyltranspeptidase/glutathione hydrolase
MTKKGIIAAGHIETAKAGAEILKAGGNAFDAAAGAALASFVAEPSLTSLGGGGFLTADPADGKAWVYDFFVQTPKIRYPVEEMDFVESFIDFGPTQQTQYIGKGSVAVPGCPAGIFQAQQDLGRLPMNVVAAPAIELARRGVEITPYQAYTIAILREVLHASPECSRIFSKGGKLVQEGDIVKHPLLANTLEALVREGVDLFYRGEIARIYARDNEENGGSVSLHDLESYRVIRREPVRYKYRDFEFLTNPPPSAGGTMISFGLALLAGREKIPPPQGPAYVAMMAGVMREMEYMRRQHLQGRLYEGYHADHVLVDSFVKKKRRLINYLGNTTHISVMDTEGNAASITTTLGGASGHTLPGTGVVSNNMLGELDLHPQGFYEWTPDSRVTSMMSPSVLRQNGRSRLVIGSGGSSRIRTAILQVLVNLIDHHMTIEEAVDHARIHYESGLINLEPGIMDETDFLATPKATVVHWQEKSMFFGGAHSVGIMADGTMQGRADQRRDGAVVEV